MNKISMLDIKKQIAPIRQELDAAIKNVIDNTGFILGEEVRNLENDVSSTAMQVMPLGFLTARMQLN